MNLPCSLCYKKRYCFILHAHGKPVNILSGKNQRNFLEFCSLFLYSGGIWQNYCEPKTSLLKFTRRSLPIGPNPEKRFLVSVGEEAVNLTISVSALQAAFYLQRFGHIQHGGLQVPGRR